MLFRSVSGNLNSPPYETSGAPRGRNCGRHFYRPRWSQGAANPHDDRVRQNFSTAADENNEHDSNGDEHLTFHKAANLDSRLRRVKQMFELRV